MAMQTTIETILKHPSARLRQLLRLKVATTTPTPVSVVSSKFSAAFNEPFRLSVVVTSADRQIDGAQWVGRRATFGIEEEASIPSAPGLVDPTVSPELIVHGVVTLWRRIKVTRDEATYKLRIEPRIALYDKVHDSGVFRDKSVKDLISELFVDRQNIYPFDIELKLEEAREKFEQTVMYEESILNFISRHCRRAGIFWYFRHAVEGDRTRRDTLVFGDNPRAYVRSLEVPYLPCSGLSNNWGKEILSIEAVRELVPASVQLWERDYRLPDDPLEAAADIAREDRSVYGSINRSTEHHRNADVGKMLSTARREEQVARQITFRGTSNIAGLMPGTVLQLTNHKVSEAPYGLVITKVVTRASRTEPAFNEFEATPAHLTWRPEYTPAKHWRWVTGTIPGVIVSNGESPYAPLDDHGRYPVRPQFLRKSSAHGTDLLALRLMKPSASYRGGFHAPLIPDTWVELQCTHGDVDRMYIAGAMNDFSHPDPVHGLSGWDSRAVWRSPLLGADIRLEDRKGQEGGKFATVYMKSSVSLGYLVDSQKRKRGEGFEAWTLGHSVIRGVRGVFLSADRQTDPNALHLEMQPAKRRLEAALSQMEKLSELASAAHAFAADIDRQRQLLAERLDELKEAVLLASAPEGMAFTSGSHLQLAAQANIVATAGGNADFGAMKNISFAAGDGMSMFAWRGAMKVISQKGKVHLHAQGNAMELAAHDAIQIISADGEVLVSANKALTLTSGGAYIKLDGGNIEIVCPGDLKLRGGSISRGAGGSMPTPGFSFGEGKELMPHDHHFVLKNPSTGEPLSGVQYRVLEPDGTIHNGVTDAAGKTKVIKTSYAQSVLKLQFLAKDE